MKRFIIRKYVTAPSAKEAIEREPSCPVDEVYLDAPESGKGGGVVAIGFHAPTEPRSDEIQRRR